MTRLISSKNDQSLKKFDYYNDLQSHKLLICTLGMNSKKISSEPYQYTYVHWSAVSLFAHLSVYLFICLCTYTNHANEEVETYRTICRTLIWSSFLKVDYRRSTKLQKVWTSWFDRLRIIGILAELSRQVSSTISFKLVSFN